MNLSPIASKLEEAIMCALVAHQGQKNVVTGEPYVLHPLRVMNRVRRAGGDEDAMICGVLHDVYEDTEHSLDGVECKFNSRVAGALRMLTRARDLKYETYIWLIKNNAYSDITVMVKLADLADNLAQGKDNPMPEPRQSELTKRYKAAQRFLLDKSTIQTRKP